MTNANDSVFATSGIYDAETKGRGTSNVFILKPEAGLSKREYFAAMALQGLMVHDNPNESYDKIAKIAVSYADALIIILNK